MLLIASLFVLSNKLLFGLTVGWWFFMLLFVLPFSLFGVVFGGLLNRQFFGLLSFIQHFLLRIFLWCLNYLPWNLIPFLDEAVERLFLRKVDGSYIFVHRLLLEYFASLEEQEP